MAGFYPDAPGNRFAYHQDGTQMYISDGSTLTALTTSQLSLLNDEDSDGVTIAASYATRDLIIIFPEPRDFTGYYVDNSQGNRSLSVSADTTNGLDGTWTTIAATWVNGANGSPIPTYRTKIQTVAGGTVKAIRFGFGDGSSGSAVLYALHLYGSVPLTSNPDRLIFWEPVNDNATNGAYFDWGDIAQGTSRTKTFRIKNNSAAKTATSVAISSTAVTFGMTVLFSIDGTNYAASVNIGNLAPGATSSVLYVKRSVPAAEPMQPQACYFTADATSWA